MKKTVISALLLSAFVGAGATAPLWLRDVRISPDGKNIAFTYKGDIYRVATGGGKAMRLTTQPSYEACPVWSPDGSKIAFASDREGSMDIYVMDSEGGSPVRLTSVSVDETPEAFSPDGKSVIFSAAIQDVPSNMMFPSRRLTELYRVPVAGGRYTQILSTPAQMISYLPGTESFVYQDQKGMENEWRKHHTSSVTRDIWLYDAASGKHTNLTRRGGEDRNPVVSTDGKTIYFLSERNGGSFNVYSFPIDNPSQVSAVTDFKTHPVRFLSRGADGTMAFAYDGEIYTMRDGASPAKVEIDIVSDDVSPVRDLSVSSGARYSAVSPDGKQVAFVKRGEVFVTSVEYKTTKQITHTPEAESEVAWAKDNRTLYYTSERDGAYNIYKAEIARKEDPDFPNATVIREEPVFKADGIERKRPEISPDGEYMAYIQDRNRIMVRNLASGADRQLTDGSTYPQRDGDFHFSWSPDGRWIAADIVDRKHDPYYDVALINVASGEVTNITNSGYFDMAPRWVMEGNAIMYSSDRYGMRNHASWGSMQDVMLVFLNREAYDRFRLSEEDYALLKEAEKSQKKEKETSDTGKKKDKKKEPVVDDSNEKSVVNVELDGISDRIVRLTPFSSDLGDSYVTDDGETLYFLASVDDGYDLWKTKLRKGETELAKKLGLGGVSLQPDADGKNLFLLGSGTMRKMNLSSDKITPISYSAWMKLDPAAEREYMFDYVAREEAQRFYNTNMHGVDWPAMTAAYRKFLPHISNNYDFSEMLSELLGELNVSHTGSGYRPRSGADPTAQLGLLYDMSYGGDGLKVAEIVAGGPFDRAKTQLVLGAVITAINGVKINPSDNEGTVFNDLARKKTLVSFTLPGGAEIEEVVVPVTPGAMSDLLYKRWVKRNAHMVDSLSGGRLGYVHLESMDDDSFRSVYSDVLGKYNDREGIVIDTRWNGGGRLHEDIEVLFSGKKYFTQVVRGTESCDMPSRRWNKPSIMIQCEANYSNAHGTPWVYKHQGLGKLVGAPVPGTMTSVNWVDLQDDSMYFGIPVVGYRLPDGSYLENTQLEPDVLITNDPARVVKGIDDQLETAVKTLLNDIDKN